MSDPPEKLSEKRLEDPSLALARRSHCFGAVLGWKLCDGFKREQKKEWRLSSHSSFKELN